MSHRQSVYRMLSGTLLVLLLLSGCDVEGGADVVFVTPVDPGPPLVVATRLPPNSTTLGNLAFVGEVDLFRIDLFVAGTLIIETSGNTDTLGTLLNVNGFIIAVDDDSGFGRNFFLSALLPPGTYFIEVEGAGCCTVGPYILDVDFIPL